MSKAITANKKDAGPSVVRFKARLVRLSTSSKSASGALLDIPKAAGVKLRDMIRLEGIINGHPFRAPLEPNASGGYSLRVNQAMLRGANADVGDTVQLAVLGPEPEPVIPADLRSAFKASNDAKALWSDLTTELRRDWIRWIESTENAETRARRVRRTIEQLSEGKRRPCCVNFYEYMLQRVNPAGTPRSRSGLGS
jgi:Bacteriocin-protection, YdeI or OmpD-Associated/Domain of unknown function (DUF1905)